VTEIKPLSSFVPSSSPSPSSSFAISMVVATAAATRPYSRDTGKSVYDFALIAWIFLLELSFVFLWWV